MLKKYYTEVERMALCKKYLSGKESRKEFCEVYDISPKSLSRWLLKASKSKVSKFVPIGELAVVDNVLIEITLPSGIDIKLGLDVARVGGLIKGLL
jgi:hypothetical protein